MSHFVQYYQFITVFGESKDNKIWKNGGNGSDGAANVDDKGRANGIPSRLMKLSIIILPLFNILLHEKKKMSDE